MGCQISKGVDSAFSYKPVTIDNFRVLEIIGKGTFGKVCIVERKSDKKLLALKYSSKEKCIAEKAATHIIQERHLLEKIRHGFVCSLRYSFQDDEFLYMVLDLMRGGDLRFHMKAKRFTESECRSIIAETAVGLQFLHSIGIAHRDIKPDVSQGHDMAPEMISNMGYGAAVDWWSLGVMLFEMVCGERPFRSKMRREFIKRCKYKFPESITDVTENCKTLISGFLQLDPRRRLGHGTDGLFFLMDHPFFKGMEWSDVENKKYQPVFVPVKSDANFKTDADGSDLLKHSALKRRTNHSAMSQNQLYAVFQEFSYFDYNIFREGPEEPADAGYPVPAVLHEADHDRVNMAFDTMNSTGGNRWMTGHGENASRRPSMSSQYSMRRKSSYRPPGESQLSPDGMLSLPNSPIKSPIGSPMSSDKVNTPSPAQSGSATSAAIHNANLLSLDRNISQASRIAQELSQSGGEVRRRNTFNGAVGSPRRPTIPELLAKAGPVLPIEPTKGNNDIISISRGGDKKKQELSPTQKVVPLLLPGISGQIKNDTSSDPALRDGSTPLLSEDSKGKGDVKLSLLFPGKNGSQKIAPDVESDDRVVGEQNPLSQSMGANFLSVSNNEPLGPDPTLSPPQFGDDGRKSGNLARRKSARSVHGSSVLLDSIHEEDGQSSVPRKKSGRVYPEQQITTSPLLGPNPVFSVSSEMGDIPLPSTDNSEPFSHHKAESPEGNNLLGTVPLAVIISRSSIEGNSPAPSPMPS